MCYQDTPNKAENWHALLHQQYFSIDSLNVKNKQKQKKVEKATEVATEAVL